MSPAESQTYWKPVPSTLTTFKRKSDAFRQPCVQQVALKDLLVGEQGEKSINDLQIQRQIYKTTKQADYNDAAELPIMH